MSGMITSQTMTSGDSSPMSSTASVPEAAESTSKRLASSARSTTFRTLRLSSTTRTLGTIPRPHGLLFLRVGRRRLAVPAPGDGLVDVGRDAQQELLHAARDRLGNGGQVGPLGPVEAEARLLLSLGGRHHGREGFLAGQPGELSMDHAVGLEDDGTLAGREGEDEPARLAAERDGLRGLGEVHHAERALEGGTPPLRGRPRPPPRPPRPPRPPPPP